MTQAVPITEQPIHDGGATPSFAMAMRVSPSGEPYTHVLVATSDGIREILEVHPDEIRLAEIELHNAILDKRASYVVIHPLNRDGAEHHYPGTIAGFIKMDTELATKVIRLNEENQEAEKAARLLGTGGPLGRRVR